MRIMADSVARAGRGSVFLETPQSDRMLSAECFPASQVPATRAGTGVPNRQTHRAPTSVYQPFRDRDVKLPWISASAFDTDALVGAACIGGFLSASQPGSPYKKGAAEQLTPAAYHAVRRPLSLSSIRRANFCSIHGLFPGIADHGAVEHRMTSDHPKCALGNLLQHPIGHSGTRSWSSRIRRLRLGPDGLSGDWNPA